MKEFYCANSKETEKLGRAIGQLVGDGDVICLNGDLGAGKTLLSKGISMAQGVPEADITSPTFAIMNIYRGTKNEVRHFDLYRLNRPEELEDIGFDEYVGGAGITLIEWADLFMSALPNEFLRINITIEHEGRKIALEPHGKHYEVLCEKVEALVNSGY